MARSPSSPTAAWADDNSAAPLPGGVTDPSKFPVASKGAPKNLIDLLSRKEVVYGNWEHHVGGRRLYYIDGIISFLRLFPRKKIKFLKDELLPGDTKSAVDLAVEYVRDKTDWRNQALFNWDEDVAANQLRRIRDPQPVGFTKAVHAIVACQLAIRAFHPKMSEFWVYDYMRIIPAVYNVDNLSDTAVTQINAAPNSAAQLRQIAGPDGIEALKDLRDGACVTAKTAYELEQYANTFVLGHTQHPAIGPVRFRPGKNRLGKKNATPNEYVEIR